MIRDFEGFWYETFPSLHLFYYQDFEASSKDILNFFHQLRSFVFHFKNNNHGIKIISGDHQLSFNQLKFQCQTQLVLQINNDNDNHNENENFLFNELIKRYHRKEFSSDKNKMKVLIVIDDIKTTKKIKERSGIILKMLFAEDVSKVNQSQGMQHDH